MADEKPNRLTPQKQTPAVIKFLLTLFGGFSMLLWIGYCSVAYKLPTADSFLKQAEC
jgi:hypothetical protein